MRMRGAKFQKWLLVFIVFLSVMLITLLSHEPGEGQLLDYVIAKIKRSWK